MDLLLGNGPSGRKEPATLPGKGGGVMIGGIDIELWVRDATEAINLILRTVRRHWPRSVLQNADDRTPFSPGASDQLPTPSGRGFFIYRDAQAARSWDKHGAIPENSNTMLHVILGGRVKSRSNLKSLTLVCDELTGEMQHLIEELRTGLDCLTRMSGPGPKPEAVQPTKRGKSK
jgi:hypothetical protein